MLLFYFNFDKITNNEIEVSSVLNIAPFLIRNTLNKVLDHIEIGSLNANLLADIAPFLDRDRLSKLVEGLINKER